MSCIVRNSLKTSVIILFLRILSRRNRTADVSRLVEALPIFCPSLILDVCKRSCDPFFLSSSVFRFVVRLSRNRKRCRDKNRNKVLPADSSTNAFLTDSPTLTTTIGLTYGHGKKALITVFSFPLTSTSESLNPLTFSAISFFV